MEIISFTQIEVKKYLDNCIIHWRMLQAAEAKTADEAYNRDIAIFYIDAYQSMRTSIFGELLP